DVVAAAGSLRITSPLGRTGLVARLRIVAQITAPPSVTLSPVHFFVDGVSVGSVDNGPPFAVDWVDENPFEPREIVVQTLESTGHVLRDAVVLPAYAVEARANLTGILMQTSVYDAKTGRLVSSLAGSDFAIHEDGVP